MLDRLRALSYIGACAAAAACHPRLAPLVPTGLPPADRDAAVAWCRSTLPVSRTAMRFRWRYRDERVSGGGRGQIRLAPPDSLRLDYVATLGMASGAGVLIGDSLVWADPNKDFRSLVRGAAILWAALGTARPPAADALVYGRQDSGQVVWRFVHGADTLDYVASAAAPRRLEAEWRRAGRIEARSRTLYDAQARPASARIDVPEEQARFELTIVAVDTAAVIAPALWRSRR